MTRTFCKAVGAALLLLAVLGFANPRLLGMHLTPMHDFIFLVSGGVAVYLALKGSRSAVRSFCLAFGAMYLSLGVLGLVAPDVLSAMIALDVHVGTHAFMPDSVVHFLLGGTLLAAGLRNERRFIRA